MRLGRHLPTAWRRLLGAGALLLPLAASCLNPQPDTLPQNENQRAPGTESSATPVGPNATIDLQPGAAADTPAPRPAEMSQPEGGQIPALTPEPEAPGFDDDAADAGPPPADAGPPDAAPPANAL